MADCPHWHTLKNNPGSKKQLTSKTLRSPEESLDATFSNLQCEIQIRMVAGFAEVVESEATLVALARFELTISTRSPAHLLTRQAPLKKSTSIVFSARRRLT
jgi:hypothetical protein